MIQDDGGIVVAGVAGKRIGVARYTPPVIDPETATIWVATLDGIVRLDII